ncbi:MAG: hypothetical protein ACYTEL_00555 [Planctomycetota bacterium]|jgi:hypothetical protein
MKRILVPFIGFALVLTLAGSSGAVILTFFTDEAAWLAAIQDVEVFSTSPLNIATADEVTSPLVDFTPLGSTLTFRAVNTGLSRTFVLEALEPGADIVFRNASYGEELSIGAHEVHEDDDWQMTFSGGPPLYAFGFDLIGNNDPGTNNEELFSVYGLDDSLLGTTQPPFWPPSTVYGFFGVVSNTPIGRVEFDEDTTPDDIDLAEFRFATRGALITYELIPPQGGYGTKIKIQGSAFGDQRSGMSNATKGYYSFITFTNDSDTLIATKYPKWTDTELVVKFQNLFIDQDGDYLQDGDEPIETEIIEMNLVDYDVRVNTLWFTDNNDSDTYDEGDTVDPGEVFSSDPVTFTQTDDPVICSILPVGGQEPGKIIRIRGYNLGDGSVTPRVVHVNKRSYQHPHFRIRLWTPTKIRFKLPNYYDTFFGGQDFRRRKIWITVGTSDSNTKRFKVLKPVVHPPQDSCYCHSGHGHHGTGIGCTACH